ncbi:MAG: AAA family ATPase [Thermoplasmatales archaeon]|nr:AAA family ATPase [Thermoplasmatales archaeon]
MKEPFEKFIKNELKPGTLLIACGLPGTYKTETTEEVSKLKGYPILRTDLIRREVLKDVDIFDEKVANNYEIRKRVYDEMFKRAEESLQKDKGVILDATFVTQELRRRAAGIAAAQNKTFLILQTNCSKDASINRILKRTKENYESNALTEQAYLNNLKKFENVDLNDLKSLYPELPIVHLTVDTELDTPEDWYIIRIKKR